MFLVLIIIKKYSPKAHVWNACLLFGDAVEPSGDGAWLNDRNSRDRPSKLLAKHHILVSSLLPGSLPCDLLPPCHHLLVLPFVIIKILFKL